MVQQLGGLQETDATSLLRVAENESVEALEDGTLFSDLLLTDDIKELLDIFEEVVKEAQLIPCPRDFNARDLKNSGT